jgi:hypothetical protein
VQIFNLRAIKGSFRSGSTEYRFCHLIT